MKSGASPDRLTAADVAFLADVLDRAGNREAVLSLLRDDESFTAVLDLDAVFAAVIDAPSIVGISPPLYFYVIVRRVFRKAGLDDVAVTQYVAALLSRKVSRERGSQAEGAEPAYAVDFIERIQASRGSASFDWWLAAGDHFLVLTGLFADFIRRRTEDRGAPALGFYEDFGSRAYRAAGDHVRARRDGLAETLHHLSDAFGDARRALNRAAEDYLFLAN